MGCRAQPKPELPDYIRSRGNALEIKALAWWLGWVGLDCVGICVLMQVRGRWWANAQVAGRANAREVKNGTVQGGRHFAGAGSWPGE